MDLWDQEALDPVGPKQGRHHLRWVIPTRAEGRLISQRSGVL